MSKESYSRLKCPAGKALSILGDQWTLMIARDALYGIKRFEGFQSSLGISRNLLTRRLKDMTDNGLLRREIIPGTRRYAYHPTRKCVDLRTTLLALSAWGDNWLPEEEGPRLALSERGTGDPVVVGFVNESDGTKVKASDVNILPGPGAHPDLIRRLVGEV